MGQVKKNGFVPCRKEIKILFLFSFYFAMNFRNIPQTSDFRVQTEFSFILQ